MFYDIGVFLLAVDIDGDPTDYSGLEHSIDLIIMLGAVSGAIFGIFKGWQALCKIVRMLQDIYDDWFGEPERPGEPRKPGIKENIAEVRKELTEVKEEMLQLQIEVCNANKDLKEIKDK